MSGKRPGGWVDGIGWVAIADHLHLGDQFTTDVRKVALGYHVEVTLCTPTKPTPVIVTRWADGSIPEEPS